MQTINLNPLVSLILLGLTLSAPSCLSSKAAQSAVHAATAPSNSEPIAAQNYTAALAALDAHIASMKHWTEVRPQSWPDWEGLANDYRRRAQLSGDYADYSAAQAALDTAFKVAPQGSGPFLSRARLNFTMHRIFAVEPDLKQAEKAIILKNVAQTQINALRADVAYVSGDYAAARKGFESALAAAPGPDVLGRIADFDWQTGDFDAARKLLETAQQQTEPKSGPGYATLLLQRASLELDSGHKKLATELVAQAETAFPGWWLTAGHQAALDAEFASHPDQLKIWQALADKTGRAEFMDQVAGVYQHMGDSANAALWSAKAGAIYTREIQQFPEATYGHAIDHFLAFEPDPARYIALAQQNLKARPNGGAHVKLAEAYLKAKQLDQAAAEIETTLKTAYRSPELHATAMRIYTAQGRSAEAEAQKQAALALNPHFDFASDPFFAPHHH